MCRSSRSKSCHCHTSLTPLCFLQTCFFVSDCIQGSSVQHHLHSMYTKKYHATSRCRTLLTGPPLRTHVLPRPLGTGSPQQRPLSVATAPCSGHVRGPPPPLQAAAQHRRRVNSWGKPWHLGTRKPCQLVLTRTFLLLFLFCFSSTDKHHHPTCITSVLFSRLQIYSHTVSGYGLYSPTTYGALSVTAGVHVRLATPGPTTNSQHTVTTSGYDPARK